MNRGRLLVAGACVGIGASLAFATGAEVTLLLPGEKVTSTLAAGGDAKVVAFAGVEGSTLSITAKALKGSRVIPGLSLVAPSGAKADIGDANPKGAATAKARNVPLDATGIWRISVASPATHGGTFELSVRAKVPLSFKWSGATSAAAPADHLVPAAPGGSIRVTVRAKTIDAPAVEVLAPSGALLATATGRRGRVVFPPTRLDEIGAYTVRISGGDGAFTAKAVVAPASKRKITFADVESRPDIVGFSPATTTNQTTLSLHLDGVGFTQRQTLGLVSGSQLLAGTVLTGVGSNGANADLDLSSVAPGSYSIRVSTPSGNASLSATKLVVTNRPPQVAATVPSDVWNRGAFLDPSFAESPFEIHGTGFDAAAAVSVRHVASGLLTDLAVRTRTGHQTIEGTASLPAYLVGPCDVTVTDPGGPSDTLARAIELVGPTAPEAVVTTLAYDGTNDMLALCAARDEKRGHLLVVVGYYPSRNFDYFVVDLATLSVIQTVHGAWNAFLDWARAAYDPVTDTFAIVRGEVYQGGGPTVVDLFDAATPIAPRSSTTVGTGSYWGDVAADPDHGGYLVAWAAGSYSGQASIRMQPIGPDLVVDTRRRRTIAADATQIVHDAGVGYAGGGRFVVVWADGDWTLLPYREGVSATVVDADGQIVITPWLVGNSRNWEYVYEPVLARDPAGGPLAVAFGDIPIDETLPPNPYAFVLASGTFAATVPLNLGQLTHSAVYGAPRNLVYSPEQSEFVVAFYAPGAATVVRRLRPDGSVRDGYGLFEGVGILYSGAAPGQLGVVRVRDDRDDGGFDPDTPALTCVVQPFR